MYVSEACIGVVLLIQLYLRRAVDVALVCVYLCASTPQRGTHHH